MDLDIEDNINGGRRNGECIMDSLTMSMSMSMWPASASKQSRLRHSARQALMGWRIRTGRVERQQRKGVLGSRQDRRALTAIAAAAMLALLPFCRPSASLDCRFAKYILLPNPRSKMDNEPIVGDLQDDSVVESRRPRAREDACAFRTRLADGVADSEDDLAFESTDKLDAENVRFDDAQCISVGRSMARFKTVFEAPPAARACEAEQTIEGGIAKEQSSQPYSTTAHLASPEKAELSTANINEPMHSVVGTHHHVAAHRKALSDPTAIYRSSWANEDDGDDESNKMEAMNMPFWNLPRRQKRRISDYGADIPDDMSIISDISLIPTYFPSDAMKQQRHQHRALFKRLVLAKAKAARQTMRQLKRSCRDAVGHVFVEAGTHRTPECVPVGAAF